MIMILSMSFKVMPTFDIKMHSKFVKKSNKFLKNLLINFSKNMSLNAKTKFLDNNCIHDFENDAYF